MIRTATLLDIPAILDIGAEAVSRSKTDNHPVDRAKASTVLRKAINHAMMDVFVAERDGAVVGFLVAMINDQWYSAQKYATDLAFCTREGHEDQAVWLIRRLIRWARGKQVPVMTALSTGLDEHGRTGRMYEANGLRPVGGMYFLGTNHE